MIAAGVAASILAFYAESESEIEKMDAMRLVFSETEMDAQRRIKRAFDPKDVANPGKIFPVAAKAEEVAHVA